jgi:nucleoid-associated protein YgaU
MKWILTITLAALFIGCADKELSGIQTAAEPVAVAPVVNDSVQEVSDDLPEGATRYTVTADDTAGYWGISNKTYGAGKHWRLIRDANPGIAPTALRAGMVLIIPPMPAAPAEQVAAVEPPTPASGEDTLPLATDATNTDIERIYYVQASDTGGFWGISKRVYGAGKYHTLIQQANPGVDSRKLRAGMKLVIPPMGNDATPAPASEIAPLPES